MPSTWMSSALAPEALQLPLAPTSSLRPRHPSSLHSPWSSLFSSSCPAFSWAWALSPSSAHLSSLCPVSPFTHFCSPPSSFVFLCPSSTPAILTVTSRAAWSPSSGDFLSPGHSRNSSHPLPPFSPPVWRATVWQAPATPAHRPWLQQDWGGEGICPA